MRVGPIVLVLALAGMAVGGERMYAYQQEQAADRVAAADRQYREEVLGVANRLVAARAPVTDAEALDLSTDSDDVVRYDVLVGGALPAEFTELLEAIARVEPPAPRVDLHRRLERAVRDMRDAVDRMAQPNRTAIQADLDKFGYAAIAWDRSLRDAFDEAPEALPTDRLPSGTQTRAGAVFRWSTSCAKAQDELDAHGDFSVDDLDATAAFAETVAVSLRRTLGEMLEVELPEADRAQLERDVLTPLRGIVPAAEEYQQLSAALRERAEPRAEEHVVALDQFDVLFETAARGMEAYGSSTCSVLLDAGLVGEPSPDDAGDEPTDA